MYIECIAGYRPTCNECADPASYLPKMDRGVTRPVYDCGQGNCPLGKVPGSSAGRLGHQISQKGMHSRWRPHHLHAWSASPLVWKEKPSPNTALNYVISWEAFYRYNYFKMPFLIRICQFMPTLLLIAQCLPSWLELTRNRVWETLMRSLKKHSHSEWIFELFCKLFA